MKKKKTNHKKINLLLCFILAFLIGFISRNYFLLDDAVMVQERAYVEESEMISAIEKVSPAVVSIYELSNLSDFYFQDDYVSETVNSSGTGFLVDHDGLILTNRHVIKDSELDYEITFYDGAVYNAEFINFDPLEDLALLKIISEEEDLYFENIVDFGDSNDLKVGQRVMAIGNALSIYGNTVTAGIVSAIDREVLAYNDFTNREMNFSGLIQTDAAINLGNSGGPLINLNAEVIGMNVLVAESANNIGFAIPSSSLIPVLESIKEYGEIIRPFLGVRFIMLTSSQAEEIGLDTGYGAILVSGSFLAESAIYSGGPADQAGLKENDIVLEVNGQILDGDDSLNKVIRNYKVGDKLVLKIWRAGDLIEITVVLEDSSDYIE